MMDSIEGQKEKELQSDKTKSTRGDRTTKYDVMFTSYVQSLAGPEQHF
jgi:hypothetical protein